MFPNYCFKKRADDFGYEVLYMPKNNYDSNTHRSHRQINQSHARSRSRPQQCSKLCYEDLITLHALREQNDRHGLKSRTTQVRNVEFRLPDLDKQRECPLRQDGGSALSARELYRKYQQQQQQSESPSASAMPSSAADSVHGLQDSCADFFNIIYENVLEAVNGAVAFTVNKHFEDILSKVNQLTVEMSVQESTLKQINSELMSKISELNQTNLNQFKFIAQMLIDSQTIHYRALNQQRLMKQQCKNGHDHQKRSASSERIQRTTDGFSRYHNPNVIVTPEQQQTQQRPQHQLWQQQGANLSTYLQQPCTNSNTRKPSPKPARTILRRSAKGITTASMPNLHQASLASSAHINSNDKTKLHRSTTQRSPTPCNWNQLSTRPVVNQTTPLSTSTFKKCRCHCRPPASAQNFNYVLSNNSSMGRRLRSLSKTLPSLENARAHT